MTKKDIGIFNNSLSLFIIAFLSIKSLLIFSKFIAAKLFGIETTLNNFTLWGISPANSGVWGFDSVLTFYSVEIFTLLVVTTISFVFFIRKKEPLDFSKYIYLWFSVTSIVLLFAILTSGIVTQKNVFHFFNWLYLSYTAMLIIALISLIAAFVFGIVFYEYFYIFRSSNKERPILNYYGQLRAYATNAIYPTIAGLFLLYIPNITNIKKYDIVEIGTILVFFSAGLFMKMKEFKPDHTNAPTVTNKPLYIFAIVCYLCFFVFKIL